MRWPSLVVVCGAFFLGGCIDQQSAPALTGPSGFGTTLELTATPNVLPRDGVTQSVIGVTAIRDGSPLANQLLSLSTTAGTLPKTEVVTDGQGRTTFALVAPGVSEVATVIVISVTPVGVTDAASSRTSTVRVSLSGQPPAPLPTADFTITPATPAGNQAIVFDASTSKAGTGTTIVSYTWDFGIGGVLPQTTGNPLYKFEGYPVPLVDTLYVVTLTIEDSLGRTAVKQKTVTIKP